MKPNQLYMLEPISVEFNFQEVVSAFNSLKTEENENYYLSSVLNEISIETIDLINSEKRVKCNFYMYEGDDKWGAKLFSILFDDKPFMIVKNNGRYFEHYESFVTDLDTFLEIKEYIIDHFSFNHPALIASDLDIADLSLVGNYKLENYYQKNLDIKYKIGDEVWAWVPENHLNYPLDKENKGDVLTKVRITEINKFHPVETYYGEQLERTWLDNEIVLNQNSKVTIGATMNEQDIIGKVNEMPVPIFAINNFVDEKGFLNKEYKMKKKHIS